MVNDDGSSEDIVLILPLRESIEQVEGGILEFKDGEDVVEVVMSESTAIFRQIVF